MPIPRDWKSRHPPVALLTDCGYKRAFRTVRQGMPRPFLMLEASLVCRFRLEEWSSKMPKMKTKSSAKKRFKITATGKVVAAAAGKRHGMIKRSNKFIRDARGTMILAEPDGKKVIKNYLPNGL
jgi:large subunit ribosomal protein L35